VSPLAALLVLIGGGWVLRSATAPTLGQGGSNVVRSLRVDVLREIPHDTTAYTQGLLWWRDSLYESTGQYGNSTLRRVDPDSGTVEQRIDIDSGYFAEGLARVDDRLILLTWKAQRAFVYDINGFATIGTHSYRGEGWGLCHDGTRLIMSDGSDTLTFRDPGTFDETGTVSVTLRGQPQQNLNELECVDGSVYANVWEYDYIVRIDPETGRVTHQIDAAGLLTRDEARGTDVLNGIAYDPEAETFYITGKLWPKMFEVRFVE
jgi:glutaminyl-peptide cyclotransferase